MSSVAAVLRRTVTIAAFLVIAIGAAVPAHGQEFGPAEVEPPPVETHIVGGSIAPAGSYGWTAALIKRGASRLSGFTCGATVLSRSWVLTAAHCVTDDKKVYPDAVYGRYVAPSAFDVLTSTRSINGSDGQRLQVAAIHAYPYYNPADNDYDLALLRLARPTSAPEIAVVNGSGADLPLDDPGVTAYTSGWGTTSFGGPVSSSLRYVGVPIQSDTTCGKAYYPGFRDDGFPLEYDASNMICAGPMGGGKDSCQGDSGGPLAVPAPDDTWRLVGVVSFGFGCGVPGYPGVYQRLSSSHRWIGNTRRYGPFDPDGTDFITRQFLDFAGRSPSAKEISSWKARLQLQPPRDLINTMQNSAGWDGNAGMNTRLYRAAFLRTPDTYGLAYWVRQRWAGRGPVSIANHFTASSEFQSKYGKLSTDDFVTRIYQNVFDRDPDAGGRAYWVNKLNGGAGRGQMLYELSNSSEYRNDTANLVRIVTTRFGLLRTVPSAGEISASQGLSQRTIIDTLRTSVRYASRFNG